MDKNIQSFIDAKRQELERLKASKKQKNLIQKNLAYKIFSPPPEF